MARSIKIFFKSFGALLFASTLGLGAFWTFQKEESAHDDCFPVKEEKPFVIIIPSYNNSAFCEQNLRSVLDQDYTNYRIVYIDDNSTDDTYEKVKEIVKNSSKRSFITLIHNEKNQGAVANLYQAIHNCADNEIIVCVDGDDFLAHPHVLCKLNKTYANPDVWMTYGSYVDYPVANIKENFSKEIPQRVIKENSYRAQEWSCPHLRTFYASLFKQVKLEDFLYKGRFLPMAWDVAFSLPMFEMSGKHAVFIKDTLYLFNRQNPISDHIVNLPLQQECDKYVRGLPVYSRLASQSESHTKNEHNKTADLLIFSYDRPIQLYALLESLETYVFHLGRVSVIYRTSADSFTQAYDVVRHKFKKVHFIKQSEHAQADFKPLLLKEVYEEKEHASDYILFAVDDMIIKDTIDLGLCIKELEKTKAYGFYLGYGNHVDYCYPLNCHQGIPPNVSLGSGVYAWRFKDGTADWNYPHSVDLVLYRKKDIKENLEKLAYHHPNSFEAKWAEKSDSKKIGLFYKESRAVTIPVNIVSTVENNRNMQSFSPQELLEKFNANQKIDIAPLYKIHNSSRHIDYNLTFIPREISSHE